MMKKFLKNNFVFFLILSLPFLTAIILLYDYLPAPRITNSYSLNEKLKFVAERKKKNPEIISIGSSIAFNNLSSQVIVDSFKTDSYLNMSSWGMRIRDSYWIIKESITLLKPKRVIIASSITDFNGPSIVYNIDNLEDYLKPGNLFNFQIQNLDLKYFFKRLITNSWYFNSNDIYKSLKFDDYGAVLLSDSHLEVIEKRWMQEVSFDYLSPESYMYLDSISRYLAEERIELVFIQSPVREAIRTLEYKEKIQRHMRKVDSILHAGNHHFIDCTSASLDDSLYADSQHLNVHGADVFTKYWIGKYFAIEKSSFVTNLPLKHAQIE